MTLTPIGWRDLFMNRPDLASDAALAQWPEHDWPLVVRRPDQHTSSRQIALGIPLPPSRGKRRVAVNTDPAFIQSAKAPPTLADVRPIAPSQWQDTIDAVLGLGSSIGLVPRVFGSFAWQTLTGLVYIGPTSDLDLLWPLSPDTEHLLASLPAIEQEAPGALDGELVCDGAAVNWRELAQGTEQVLVKTLAGVQLTSQRDFLARAARA